MAGGDLAFGSAQLSDAKRVTRREHYLLADNLLLARDHLRSSTINRLSSPSFLILAGGSPAGEIDCIRHQCKGGSWITAVDSDARCVQAATDAGADQAVCVDLNELFERPVLHRACRPPSEIGLPEDRPPRYHVVNLDFCGSLEPKIKRTVRRISASCIEPGGVLLVSFMYGRERQQPHFLARARGGDLCGVLPRQSEIVAEHLMELGSERDAAEALIGRLATLGDWMSAQFALKSVLIYRANDKTPMCSALWHSVTTPRGFYMSQPRWPQDLTQQPMMNIDRVTDDDLPIALTHPELDQAMAYAVPRERLTALRRSAVAQKAVATRRRRLSQPTDVVGLRMLPPIEKHAHVHGCFHADAVPCSHGKCCASCSNRCDDFGTVEED